jgi:hypothetical protein
MDFDDDRVDIFASELKMLGPRLVAHAGLPDGQSGGVGRAAGAMDGGWAAPA